MKSNEEISKKKVTHDEYLGLPIDMTQTHMAATPGKSGKTVTLAYAKSGMCFLLDINQGVSQ